MCHLATGGSGRPYTDVISGRKNATKPPAPAPLTFHINAVWSINTGRLVAEKHLEISIPGGADATWAPSFTVRSVSLFDGTSFGDAPFSNQVVAYNPKHDFGTRPLGHPLTLDDCKPSCYIAAFWRGDTSGAFISIANPYGNYTSNGTSDVQAWYEPEFLFAPGVRSAPAVYTSEPVVLGLTVMEPYWISQGHIPALPAAALDASVSDIAAAAPGAPAASSSCPSDPIVHQIDSTGKYISGSPFTNLSVGAPGAAQCKVLCCNAATCDHFTFAWKKVAPSRTMCYLKTQGALAKSADCSATDQFECYSGEICKARQRVVGSDAPGGDLMQIGGVDEPTCQTACCNNTDCAGYTFTSAAPANFGDCKHGAPCCYLKGGHMPAFKPKALPGLVSVVVRAGTPHPGPRPGPPPGPTPIVPPTPSDINQGEWRAFTRAVETFLLDGGADRKPVRVQVGWDSNDYQMDVANATEWAEYQRLLTIASSMGITHTTFAPRNTKHSARVNATDAWRWEETLWFALGEQIREGRWLPGRDPVPADVQKFVAFADKLNIKFLAYAYPTLPFTGPGAFPVNGEGWLYNKSFDPQPWEVSSNLAASIADPAFQEYFAKLLIEFVTATGCGGFAWDYGINGDWRQPNTYGEWRGWMRILKELRAVHPDVVMDHRQTAHQWGPWYQLAGSYTEPISGDENPESYGAAGQGAVPTLSTDHVLADNLRRVNFVYRARQLIPNHRVPGFMFHQSERSNNSGPANGRSDGISTLIWDHDIHTRDFDRLGFKYSVISSVGTAGLNNVLAMLPGRNQEAYDKFPAADKSFVKRWLDWAEDNMKFLTNTQAIADLMTGDELGGKPGLDRIDGVAAMSDDGATGFLFLFNPGPTRPTAEVTADEAIGIFSNASAATRQWLVHEIFPREELNGTTTPLAVVTEGGVLPVSLRANKAQVLRLTEVTAGTKLPIVLGASYTNASFSGAELKVTGATGLTGLSETVEAVVPVAVGTTVMVTVNGQKRSAAVLTAACSACGGHSSPPACSCAFFDLAFAGSPLTEMMSVSETRPDAAFGGGWFNTTFGLTPAMWAQRQARQQEFDIDWVADDMDAPWLGNRLMMYPYILQPEPNGTIQANPRMWIDGDEVNVVPAYNSRGHIYANCFMGFFYNATEFVESNRAAASEHSLDILLPQLNTTAGQRLVGVYWYGTEDAYTASVSL